MALTPESGTPCSAECGNTLTFKDTFAEYPTSAWTARLYLSLNGEPVANAAATESNGEYVFNVTAEETEGFEPGVYDYAIYATNADGQRQTAKRGQISFTPNLAAEQTPSFAQAQVTLLESLIATINASDKEAVSFNGQSFTRANRDGLVKQWTFWKSRVIADQRAALRAQGKPIGDNYAPNFGTTSPYAGCR